MMTSPDSHISLLLDTSEGVAAAVYNTSGRILCHRFDDSLQAENIASITESLLSQAAASVSDIGEMFLALGPGSFTGLRAGIAFVMGLRFPERFTLYGFSSLTPRLPGGGAHSRVAAVIPAKRGFYYMRSNIADRSGTATESLISTENLLALSAEISVLCVSGHSKENKRLEGRFTSILQGGAHYDFQKARLCARESGPLPNNAIKPNYIQLPAAETGRPGNSRPAVKS